MQDDVIVALKTFGGERVWEETFPVRVAANDSRPINRWEANGVGGGDRYLSVRSWGGLFPRNRCFFAAIKDLRRPPARPETTITPISDHEIHVNLQAPEYSYFVHLFAPDEQATFSDDYFDLEPGESRTVVVANEGETLEPKSVEVSWR